ncbi:MAG: hypothetical protein GQ570_13205 [Helicobacteraceae bacterium]|nr:hypothetical protein [Helicobacteraceae bacterium]
MRKLFFTFLTIFLLFSSTLFAAELTLKANGGALQFDGDFSNKVNLGDISALNSVSAFTIETWVKANTLNAGHNYIFNKIVGADTNNRMAIIIDDAKNVLINISNGTNTYHTSTAGNLGDNEWHHLSLVYDGSGATNDDKVKVYIDGSLTSAGASSATFPTSTADMNGNDAYLGSAYDGSGSKVLIDDFRIWSSARTQSDISLNMNYQLDGNETSLVAYYNFDERVGDTVYDITSNNNDATIEGNVTRLNFLGDSLSFDGADDGVTVADADHLDLDGTDFSIASWVKFDTDSPNWSHILSKTNYELMLNGTTGQLLVRLSDGASEDCQSDGTNLKDNTWHYLSASYNLSSNSISLFIDGNLDKTCTMTKVVSASVANITIGDDGSTALNDVKGDISQVSLWNKALTQIEFQHLMASAPDLTDSNLVGYWPLNEGAGTTAYDHSTNANSGAITGATWVDTAPKILGNNIYTSQYMAVENRLVVDNNTTTPTYSYNGNVPSSIYDFNGTTGTFAYYSSTVGSETLDINASDGGNSLSEQFNVTVYESDLLKLSLDLTNVSLSDHNITNIQVIGVDGISENFDIPDIIAGSIYDGSNSYSVPVYNEDQNFTVRVDTNNNGVLQSYWVNFSDAKLYHINDLSTDFKTNINSSNNSFSLDLSTENWVYEIEDLTAGGYHSIYLDNDGDLFSWGSGSYGQLGLNDENSSKSTPQYVSSLSNIIAVGTGTYTSFAIDSSYKLWSWGNSGQGQLGLGDTVSRNAPTDTGLTNAKAVDAGSYISVVLKNDGTVWTTGGDGSGYLGDGTADPSTSFIQVKTDSSTYLTDVVGVAAGNRHFVAVKSDGTVWTWGSNYYGALGSDLIYPQQVSNISNAISVEAGDAHSVVLTLDGKVYAFGLNNNGESGGGTITSPYEVVASNATKISAGGRTTMYMLADGSVKLIGANTNGQGGSGSTATPTTASSTFFEAKAFSTGVNYALILNSSDELYASGINANGEHADGTTTASSVFENSNASFIPPNFTLDITNISASIDEIYVLDENGTQTLLSSSISTPTESISTNVEDSHNFAIKVVLSDSSIYWYNFSDQKLYSEYTADANFFQPLSTLSSISIDASTPNWLSTFDTSFYKLISNGEGFALAIKNDGTLWAWGDNYYGQLGDGTTSSTELPIQIGSDNDWHSISASRSHVLATKTDGTLLAWGRNNYSQLGDGTTTNRTIPTQIGSDTTWVHVSVGTYHSTAIKSDGTLWTWGSDSDYQLGSGSNSDQSTPSQIGSDTNWAKTFAYADHTLAIKTDGTLYAWGDNYYGVLGDGTEDTIQTPALIDNNTTWVSVATGYAHTVALRSDGTIYSWGANYSGQLGDGSTTNNFSPTQIGTDTDWYSIASGEAYSSALKSDGTLWSWGDNNFATLGDGTTTNRSTPTQIGSDTSWVALYSGSYNSFAAKNDNTLFAWGKSDDGQYGDGSDAYISLPTSVTTSNTYTKVVAGYGNSIAIKDDGTLWGWGDNDAGLLNGDKNNQTLAVQIDNNTTWSDVSLGFYHALALRSDGTLWSWGEDTLERLGNGASSDVYTPTQIDLSNTYQAISASGFHNLAIHTDGTLYSWGNNADYQVGDGTTTTIDVPTQIDVNTNWVAVAAGRKHSLALEADGTLWAWGDNTSGQLGDATNTAITMPTQVGSGYSDIVAASYSSYGIKTDGTLWEWGNGTNIQTQVESETTWSAISYDGGSMLAMKDDGTLWKSGTSQIVIDGTISSFSAGVDHNFVLKSDGTLLGWGGNDFGQLGFGVLAPLQVYPGTINISLLGVDLSTYNITSLYAIKSDSSSVLISDSIDTGDNYLSANVDYNEEYSLQINVDGSAWYYNFADGKLYDEIDSSEPSFFATIDGSNNSYSPLITNSANWIIIDTTPPTISTIYDQFIPMNSSFTLAFTIDDDKQQDLTIAINTTASIVTYTAPSSVQYATYSTTPVTLTITPVSSDANGTQSFELVVTDINGNETSKDFNVNIQPQQYHTIIAKEADSTNYNSATQTVTEDLYSLNTRVDYNSSGHSSSVVEYDRHKIVANEVLIDYYIKDIDGVVDEVKSATSTIPNTLHFDTQNDYSTTSSHFSAAGMNFSFSDTNSTSQKVYVKYIDEELRVDDYSSSDQSVASLEYFMNAVANNYLSYGLLRSINNKKVITLEYTANISSDITGNLIEYDQNGTIVNDSTAGTWSKRVVGSYTALTLHPTNPEFRQNAAFVWEANYIKYAEYHAANDIYSYLLLNKEAKEELYKSLSPNPKIRTKLDYGYTYISLPHSKTLCDEGVYQINSTYQNFCDQDNTLNSVFGVNSNVDMVLKFGDSWTYWDSNSTANPAYNISKTTTMNPLDGLLIKTSAATTVDLPFDEDAVAVNDFTSLFQEGWTLMSNNDDQSVSEISDALTAQSKTLVYILLLRDDTWYIYAPTNDADVSTDIARLSTVKRYESFWVYFK